LNNCARDGFVHLEWPVLGLGQWKSHLRCGFPVPSATQINS
jgi:hypothetical protein